MNPFLRLSVEISFWYYLSKSTVEIIWLDQLLRLSVTTCRDQQLTCYVEKYVTSQQQLITSLNTHNYDNNFSNLSLKPTDIATTNQKLLMIFFWNQGVIQRMLRQLVKTHHHCSNITKIPLEPTIIPSACRLASNIFPNNTSRWQLRRGKIQKDIILNSPKTFHIETH